MGKWLKLVYPGAIFAKGEAVDKITKDVNITIKNALMQVGAIDRSTCATVSILKSVEYEVTIKIRNLEG